MFWAQPDDLKVLQQRCNPFIGLLELQYNVLQLQSHVNSLYRPTYSYNHNYSKQRFLTNVFLTVDIR